MVGSDLERYGALQRQMYQDDVDNDLFHALNRERMKLEAKARAEGLAFLEVAISGLAPRWALLQIVDITVCENDYLP